MTPAGTEFWYGVLGAMTLWCAVGSARYELRHRRLRRQVARRYANKRRAA